ncbi:hypothetical protein GCM10009077_17850 [Roseibium denhamense]|uniref:Uncharacterized protein n=1 Tax=Roseibium denhamense TaxID=76305 RepID=A0ABY1P5Z2_9HYPH|nr:hypothetical protein SAMN06265374_2787 [Roseibium denhamense]
MDPRVRPEDDGGRGEALPNRDRPSSRFALRLTGMTAVVWSVAIKLDRTTIDQLWAVNQVRFTTR